MDCRPAAKVDVKHFQRPGISQLDAFWLAWAETEKRKRLGLSIYVSLIQFSYNIVPYYFAPNGWQLQHIVNATILWVVFKNFLWA